MTICKHIFIFHICLKDSWFKGFKITETEKSIIIGKEEDKPSYAQIYLTYIDWLVKIIFIKT